MSNLPSKSFFSPRDAALCLESTLKERVQILLLRMGRSQNWLASQCSVSSGTMSRVVNREWFPSAHLMIKMAEMLECDSVVLFGDSKYWKSYNEKINYGETKK